MSTPAAAPCAHQEAIQVLLRARSRYKEWGNRQAVDGLNLAVDILRRQTPAPVPEAPENRWNEAAASQQMRAEN